MLIRVDLATFPLGKTLAKDLYSSDGRLLMPKGIILKEYHLQQLLQRGYERIFILEDENINQSPSSSLDDDTHLPEVYANTVENMRDMMAAVSTGHMVKPSEVNESIDMLLPEVTGTNNVMKHLLNLRNKDEYTLQHSVSVGVISIKIGQAMKLADTQLKNLGIAGLLHDIGKCKIPIEIINKPGPLDAAEYREIQKHPVYGYQIVNDIKLQDPDIAIAVLQHHEHQDGQGYPLKTRGEDITLFANIIAVADVFDALTSDRAYRPRMPLLKAIDHIVKGTLGHLEPVVARRLFTYILDISVGESVLLSTGETATVILINEIDPTRPLVRIDNRFLDLKTEKDIFIQDLLT